MSSPGFCLIHSGVPFYEISLPTSVAQRYEVDRENQKDLFRLLITFSGFAIYLSVINRVIESVVLILLPYLIV